jgi:two-component system, OmpR family, sensor histidine kinase VicK
MPQTTKTDPLEVPPFKKTLRLKMSVVILIVTVLPLLAMFIYTGRIVFPALIITSIIASLGIFLVWQFLNPLEKLYQAAQVIAGGQYSHRIDIKSGDEIEFISQALNNIAFNLNNTFTEISQTNSYIISEKNKLNTIVSSIVDGVIVLDLHQNIMLVNKAAERITGFDATEMTKRPVDSLITLKDDQGNILPCKKYCQVKIDDEQSPPTYFRSVALTGKMGKEVKIQLTIAKISEGLQADLGCILILHDTTQNKIFEQMQIDFVSMASHEIRTPLTSIINYLAVIKEEGQKSLGPELTGFLDRALGSAQQLASLVGNLLNVSKIERGSFTASLGPVDWKEIVTESVENNRAQAVQKNITLEIKEMPDNLPKVLADSLRINEVLNNLINNALTYTPEGGKVGVGVRISGNEILTYVADNGNGMPKDVLPHLFTKFFRVTGSLDRGSKGTGLGLYISKSIIDMHHGKIWVDSDLGQGATFYFTLPLTSPSATPTIVQLHSSETSPISP